MASGEREMAEKRGLPKRGWAGLCLIAAGWPLAWIRPNSLQFVWENSFLFLWVGYCLVVDALVWKRTGTSPFTRNHTAYVGMFFLSIPGWWLFEFFNIFLQNWHYLHNRPIGTFEHIIRSSIHFSIVIPAVLTTAELWSSSRYFTGNMQEHPVVFTTREIAIINLIGMSMLVSVIGFPRYCYPFVWICLYLIFDSMNMLLGAPALLRYLERGNWRPFILLPLGALTCGFFWEMWNFYALPKWFYSIPFFDFFHIFEMPVLGYLGYLPFGLEVFALYHLVINLFGLKGTRVNGGESYIHF